MCKEYEGIFKQVLFALRESAHALNLSNGLTATDRPDMIDTDGLKNILWEIDNSRELFSVNVALDLVEKLFQRLKGE